MDLISSSSSSSSITTAITTIAILPHRPPPHLALRSSSNHPPGCCYTRRSIQLLWGTEKNRCHKLMANNGANGIPATFLSMEEAGLIELSNLDMHERFLCRLTVSSLNLLRVISEQEAVPIEDLNAGRICDWFQKDKAKREQDIESATLKWDTNPGW